MSRRNRRKKHHHFKAIGGGYRDTKFKIFIGIFDLVLCFFIAAGLYGFVFDRAIWSIKEKLFSSTSTIIFVSSSAMLYIVQFWLSVFLIWCFLTWLSLYLLDKTKLRSSVTNDTDLRGAKKFFIYLSSVCVCFTLISFFSYSRVESNGIYIRGFRTYFVEKHYNWSGVDNVEIRSYKTESKGSHGYNYSYDIYFGGYKVDLVNCRWFENNSKTIPRVHEIVKKEGIPVYKSIEYEYEGFNRFLESLGEK